LTGLEPRFITSELTLADVTPAMSGLIPLARESRANAERAIDPALARRVGGRLMPKTAEKRADLQTPYDAPSTRTAVVNSAASDPNRPGSRGCLRAERWS
jgi:hypothetical protein